MASELRIKGRILINGNITLLTLVLLCFFGIIFFTNLSVFGYETSLMQKVSSFVGRYDTVLHFAVSTLIFFSVFTFYSTVRLGTHRFFLRRAQKKGAAPKDIFYYMHPLRAVGAFFFMLKITLLKLLVLVFALLPFVCSLLLAIYLLNNNVSAIVLAFLLLGSVAFFFSGMIFYYAVSDSLFLAKYYYIEGKYLSFSHIISSSQHDMKNKTSLLRRVKAGFFGWFLLCLLVFPIGYVWSYYNQTMAIVSDNFMKE